MKIQEANNQHIKAITEKVSQLIHELSGNAVAYDTPEVLGFIVDAMAKGTYLAFLAIDDSDDVVGIITLGESGAVYAGGKFGVIHELYVNPGARSCQIGKLLIDEAKRKSLSLNWKRLEVGAPAYPAWRRTRDFYLREGFREIGPRLGWRAEQTGARDGVPAAHDP